MLSGRLGYLSMAQSSSQGIPTSSLMPPFKAAKGDLLFLVVVVDDDDAGTKALVMDQAAERQRAAKQNFMVDDMEERVSTM
jgi:hypothetical protein